MSMPWYNKQTYSMPHLGSGLSLKPKFSLEFHFKFMFKMISGAY